MTSRALLQERPSRATPVRTHHETIALAFFIAGGVSDFLDGHIARRDKLITNVIVETTAGTPVSVPNWTHDEDHLNRIHGKPYSQLLAAAIQGTNQAYADVKRPTADIRLPRLDEHAVGQLLQMSMLAPVLEGRLVGINPYGQPGVEAYKKNMGKILGL